MSGPCYRSALAAAWMYEAFGMRFTGPSGKEFEPSVITANAGSPIEAIRNDQCYYTHPDSRHLLGPLEGDIYCYPVAASDGRLIDVSVTWHKLLAWSPRFRIIQRSGKPFFWPEYIENPVEEGDS